jgi:hypothetical protein
VAKIEKDEGNVEKIPERIENDMGKIKKDDGKIDQIAGAVSNKHKADVLN